MDPFLSCCRSTSLLNTKAKAVYPDRRGDRNGFRRFDFSLRNAAKRDPSFRVIMRDRRFRKIPKVLETPKGKELKEDVENMKVLLSLEKRSLSG